MFLRFFANLREAHVPITPREYLDLMRALQRRCSRSLPIEAAMRASAA